MSLINSTAIPSGVATGYEIGQSLRFAGGNLSRTPSSAGNRRKWSWSGWVKRAELGTYQVIWAAKTNTASIFWSPGNILRFEQYNGAGGYNFRRNFNPVMRDVSAWYHMLFIYDSAQGTETDRSQFYLNGVRQTIDYTYDAMPQNFESEWNNTEEHYIGNLGSWNYEGYVAEVHFIDGLVKAPADFGETGDYGEWKPIEYEGTYGTNGFYLDFSNSGALGTDSSGNSNTWTSNNLAATDQMLDSPTNNFATFSPLMLAVNMGTELSEGNLKNYEGSTYSGYPHNSFSTMSVTSGKWYFEVRNTLAYGAIGICNLSDSSVNQLPNSTASPLTNMPSDGEGWAFKNGNGQKEHNNSNVSYGSAITSNDVVMCAFDVDAGKIWWGVNGTWIASGNPATAANPAYTGETFGDACPVVTTENGSTAIINFGQDSSFAGNKTAQGNQDGNSIGDFYYAPPTGFLALCTSNLPDVAVIPSEHFNPVLYTGTDATNSTHAISGIGFQPDFVWTKDRDATYDHYLFDSVRGTGVTKGLSSSSSRVEGMANESYDALSSFDSDGFTITGAAFGSLYQDRNNANYVSWNWKAGNATLGTGDFTQGSSASTCSRNVDSGFSIVSYTGTGSTATVGHGLSKAPEMMIIRSREVADNWLVFANAGSMDATDGMYLDSTGAKLDSDTFFNDTAPTNSLFTVKSHSTSNNNTKPYIAYCFHSVEGFSKVGSYTGNGQADDNTFIYTGFRTAYVMIKCASAVEPWTIIDGTRHPYNENDSQLTANATSAETNDGNGIDLLSNGFKIKSAIGNWGSSGATYIYLAFAETPFKYSNAR